MKLIFAAVLLAASVPLALGQGTYTQFDVPSATYTVGVGIDSAGDVVGFYGDASGNYDGFLLSGGTYTTIDYPGSTFTGLAAINDMGQIVGEGREPNVGFLYDVQSQTFTTINRPGATFTYPFTINNAGVVGGAVTHGIFTTGFELVDSQYRVISPPRTSYSSVSGITASGTPFGVAGTTKGTFDFRFSRGEYSQFAIPNAPGAQLQGVNPAGTAVVGSYNPSSGVTAGFLYQIGTLTTLQFPGSSFTEAFGVNAAGEVVRAFDDAEGNAHGFTWTPPAAEEKK